MSDQIDQKPDISKKAKAPTKSQKGKKKRARQEDKEDEFAEVKDEEHMKKLARNRAAASRCREKKKQKLQELDQQATQLKAFNSQMETEIASLREEIEQLRQLKAQQQAAAQIQQQVARNMPSSHQDPHQALSSIANFPTSSGMGHSAASNSTSVGGDRVTASLLNGTSGGNGVSSGASSLVGLTTTTSSHHQYHHHQGGAVQQQQQSTASHTTPTGTTGGNGIIDSDDPLQLGSIGVHDLDDILSMF